MKCQMRSARSQQRIQNLALQRTSEVCKRKQSGFPMLFTCPLIPPFIPLHLIYQDTVASKYHLIVAQSGKPVQLSRTTSNAFTSYPAFDTTLANLLRHRCFKISLLHRTMWKASLNSQEQPQLEPLPF